MPTDNRRVAAYLPKEVDERLKAFIAERNLKGDSPALIVILSEYFGVNREVSYEVAHRFESITQEQVESLINDKLVQLRHHVIEVEEQLFRLHELEIRIASVERVAARTGFSSSESESESELSERLESLESRFSALESQVASQEVPEDALSTSALATRLGVASSTISHKKKDKSKSDFAKWTSAKDPDHLAWEWLDSAQKFRPIKDLNSESSSSLQGSLLSSS